MFSLIFSNAVQNTGAQGPLEKVWVKGRRSRIVGYFLEESHALMTFTRVWTR